MNLQEYWDQVKHLAMYEQPEYPLEGLTIEISECVEIYVKHKRKAKTPEEIEEKLVDELGDVLWFICELHKDKINSLEKDAIEEKAAVKNIERTLKQMLRQFSYCIVDNHNPNYDYYLILMDIVYHVGFEKIAQGNIDKLLKRAKNNEICDHK